jgi:predicted amidophosphoribosyltransferase
MYTALLFCLTIVAVIIVTAVYFATPQAPRRCPECRDIVDGNSMLCRDCQTEMRRVKGRPLVVEREASRYWRQQEEGRH